MEKIGRNDPCPCGSGKKFKKCHLGREDELFKEGLSEFPLEMGLKIRALPEVVYGRSKEIADKIDIYKLTGSRIGVRFIDLKQYQDLDVAGQKFTSREDRGTGAVVVNVLKTRESDPDNIYIAISRNITESTLLHQLAHVLDYLGGSKLMPGFAKPLGFDLGIPTEHLEHPREFGYWLDYLCKKFEVELDADDAIIAFLYENEMLIEGEFIERNDRIALQSKSEKILKFLSEKSSDLDEIIRERPGYIGSRVGID